MQNTLKKPMEVGMKKGVKKQAVSEKLHVRKTSKKPIGESGNLGIKKQYLKSGFRAGLVSDCQKRQH